jgi:3-hydroxyacyl-CoA dehydrogenase
MQPPDFKTDAPRRPVSPLPERSCIRIEREGEVALFVTDTAPPHAGLDELCRDLIGALHAIEEDNAIKAAILLGSENIFGARAVMNETGRPLHESPWTAAIEAIERCAKPVVAAIQGAALGRGFELALGCDARVALTGAVVGLPEVSSGMIPSPDVTRRVPFLVGVAAAIDIVCSGRDIGAMEAVGLGLIDVVVEGDLRAGAIAYAMPWGRAGRKRRLGEAPLPPDIPGRVEEAEHAALRASSSQAQVIATIKTIKAAIKSAGDG